MLAGDFGQLPPVAVAAEKTLLHARPLQAGQSREEVNLGLRLFLGIKTAPHPPAGGPVGVQGLAASRP